MSITPSISFAVDIPGNISEPWYDGNVHVLFKDTAFEHLSHANMQLNQVQSFEKKPLLFYTQMVGQITA